MKLSGVLDGDFLAYETWALPNVGKRDIASFAGVSTNGV
jgi:hypothetical protein